ncbi:hypothetical protein KPH14_002642 [Odynerus spinipes]|uniref:Uncharacterized protein n=1 Tax=Odynerus spinipes TaxID=1348599 RepID=A0AAD9RH67_9HYME|nr:hypothetical protein KPH14_002642 [Odynerus spinipes]
MKCRKEHKLDSANVVKDIVCSTPEHAKKYKKAYNNGNRAIKPYMHDQALPISIEAKLTKFQYNIIRNAAKEHNNNIYPNYEVITEAKKRCYPNNIIITESFAEVSLQSLLDHTVMRLFQVQ